MTNYEEFKDDVAKLQKLVEFNPDGRSVSGMWWGELDDIMRRLSLQYFGNIPSTIGHTRA